MFCPKCRAEYREGLYVCSDCNIDLVEEIPDEPEPEFVDFEEILSTYNPGDIAFLKSLLDAENITYFFKGEHFLHLRPLVDPARLMIRKDQVENVRDLLRDVEVSFMGLSIPNNEKTKDP